MERNWSILLNDPEAYAPLDKEEDMDVWHTGRKKKIESPVESPEEKVDITQGIDTKQWPIKRKEDSPTSDSSEWEAPKRRQKKQEKTNDKERKRDDRTPNRVFVKNLPWAANEEALVAKLSAAGNIKAAGIIRNKQNKSSGMAYADYSSADEVECAIKELNGQDIMGRPVSIDIEGARNMWGTN